jgi:hypothetical protein
VKCAAPVIVTRGLYHDLLNERSITMGKYFIAWLLGAPVFLLVIIYFLF